MTYQEFSELVMQNLDQYSVAGDPIPGTYNNQEDYTKRIVALANTAMRIIAETTEPIMGYINPDDPGFEGRKDLGNGKTIISMPQDFMRMTGRGIPTIDHGEYSRTMHYMAVTDREFIFDSREVDNVIVTYYRYPRKLRGAPDEVLDVSEGAADAAAFYVAAQLARQDSPYVYQTLLSEFETMLARLKKPIIAENIPTDDVYGVGCYGYGV